MAVSITAGSDLAEKLSTMMQPRLVDLGWTTSGLDDSALTEYIILMLVSGKTQEQIATDLSQDLLNLPADDPGAHDFARWLFEQIAVLSGQAPASTGPEANLGGLAVAPEGSEAATGTGQNGDATGDAAMTDGADGLPGNVPTGPKNMRPNGRINARRMVGQANKAMDRNGDGVLHRVRQQGGERINMHGRQPPRGSRPIVGPGRMAANGPPMGPSKGSLGSRITPSADFLMQQQQQLFNMMAQMTQMIPQAGFGSPAMNPKFPPGGPRSQHPRLMNDRRGPRGPSGPGRPARGAPSINSSSANPDTDMTEDATMTGVVSTKPNVELSPDTLCKYNLKCTKADCAFAHQSPAAPLGTTVDTTDVCSFGVACQNRKCTGRHPSPAQKRSHQMEQECRFFPNCTNPRCPFRHPTMPICRNGADCTREGCKFTHVQTKCRFNPCMNLNCVYKHDEGQRRGKVGDSVWRANGSEQNSESHVSERKFINDDGPEELIVPTAMADTEQNVEVAS